MSEAEVTEKPIIIAVGGGKGGVGKSVFSIMLAQWLGRLGHRTVVVDLDLSGANVHTLLGIKDPPYTLYDLLSRKTNSLQDITLATEVDKLRVICGASEILSLANPVFAQKIKIMRKLYEVDASYLVLDLGAGTGFDVLDFFLLADYQIVVTTGEPIAIYNAYGFLRNAVYRRLSQLTRRVSALSDVVKTAMDPKNEHKLQTISGLYTVLFEMGGNEVLQPIRDEMEYIRPLIVVNQVRDSRDRNTTQIIQQVAEKYLMLDALPLGYIAYDPEIQKMVSEMTPLTSGSGYRGAFEAVREIASNLAMQDARSGESLTESPAVIQAPVPVPSPPQP